MRTTRGLPTMGPQEPTTVNGDVSLGVKNSRVGQQKSFSISWSQSACVSNVALGSLVKVGQHSVLNGLNHNVSDVK